MHRKACTQLTKDKKKKNIVISYFVLTTDIPDSEADVLIFHSLHVKPCK